MRLDWRDVIFLKPGERIEFQCGNVQLDQFKGPGKWEFYPSDSSKGLLVFTNKRILFITTYDQPQLWLEIPHSEVGRFEPGVWQTRTGFFGTSSLTHRELMVRPKGWQVGDQPTASFQFLTENSLEEATKQLRKCLETFEKELQEESEKSRRIEVVHRGAVGVVDFSQLASMMGQKGLVLQVIQCPNCLGKVDVPKVGNLAKCQYCGKDIYAVDIFDKFKGLLGA